MCNQSNVPSLTLQAAVLMQAKEFAQNNQTFSIHDITTALRRKTSQGELEIPECEVTGASFRYDIRHVNVKSLFLDMRRNGVFDPEFTLTDNFNGVYFEYTPVPNTAPVVATTPPANPTPVSPALTPTTTVTITLPPKPSGAPTMALPICPVSRAEVKNRVDLYLKHCVTKNFRPNMKQVQSAIKRGNHSTGWTCEDLLDVVVKDLNITVIPDPDYVSMSQVAVV